MKSRQRRDPGPFPKLLGRVAARPRRNRSEEIAWNTIGPATFGAVCKGGYFKARWYSCRLLTLSPAAGLFFTASIPLTAARAAAVVVMYGIL